MHVDPSAFQFRKSSTGNRGIGVWHHGVYLFDAGFDDSFCARSGAARGAAGLQAYVKSRAPRSRPRLFQRDDFGVIELVVLVKPLTKRDTVLDDNSSYARIRMSESHAFASEFKRMG